MSYDPDYLQDGLAGLYLGKAMGGPTPPGLAQLLLQGLRPGDTAPATTPMSGPPGIDPGSAAKFAAAVQELAAPASPAAPGSGGGAKPSADTGVATAGADSPGHASTVYGESSGLFPQLQAGTTNPYHPGNWDPQSVEQLKTAREWIAGVGLRNPKVYKKSADLSNRTERMVWNLATDAAQGAQNLQLPPGVDHFFMRQDGMGSQKPPWGKDGAPYEGKPYKTFGPFINVGGGKVPAGNKTYIDFYQGVP